MYCKHKEGNSSQETDEQDQDTEAEQMDDQTRDNDKRQSRENSTEVHIKIKRLANGKELDNKKEKRKSDNQRRAAFLLYEWSPFPCLSL